ncbi:MAG: single-stranded-DNA-specific exonuclease RecJ [Desulfobacterales bacterium]|nr:MAG: single-stranded-DNA-specific exonuclease RecJ [Desulfobacterales bacterium]
MKKQWQILRPDPHSVDMLCRELKCHPAIAAILVNRHIDSAEKASRFIFTSLDQLSSPFSIKDMDAAVNRILYALKHREKILIFGDYDVDGITATAILLEFFRFIGADVSYYIPHRIKEGYGLKRSQVLDVAYPNKVNLIITVDCGSSCYAAVAAAKDIGIDVIVTDHHIIVDNGPSASAVVNPKRRDCNAGFDDLAGVGVAFYLLICLRKKLRDVNFWNNRTEPNLKKFCDLVALGTLADMVPLVPENRVLVKTGIDVIRANNRPGLDALMEISGIDPIFVDGNDMVFRLSPRLNSAGRLDHASIAVELLTTKKTEAAHQMVRSLDNMNQKRQRIENDIFIQIERHLYKNSHLFEKNTWVLVDETWHLGILGIVATRLTRKYFRPVVLITLMNGTGKGSARSTPGVNLYDALLACVDDLETFGGHAKAAGLEIKPENIESFKIHLERAVNRMTTPEDFTPKIIIDYELHFTDISTGLIDQIETLKPFGNGNNEPLFVARNVNVISSKIVGHHHRRMRLSQSVGKSQTVFNAIQFNVDPHASATEHFDQMAFKLRWNHWNGEKIAQIIIEEPS